MLISIEGIDLSGKTTQVMLLSVEYNLSVMKFPRDETPILREYLNGKVELSKKALFFLFLADILDGVEKVKRPAVLDRYIYSTLAYSTIDYEKAKKIIEMAEPPKADIVFLLDITPEEASKRAEEKDRYESSYEVQKTARERYLDMAKSNFYAKRWHVIDARKDAIAIFKEISRVMKEEGLV